MPTNEFSIGSIASQQFGLISRAQALDTGLHPSSIQRRVKNGSWKRVQPGVFRILAAPETWRQKLMAACLAAGPDAAVSHRSAAALWRFERAGTGLVEVTASRWHRRPHGGVILHESTDLIPADFTQLGGIPVTTPLRIVLDIGTLIPAGQLETLVVESLRKGHFNFRQLWTRHRQISRKGRNGSKAIWKIIREMERGGALAHSGWEIRLDRLIRRLGFPIPVRQHRIHDEGGNFIAQVDLAYPERQIAIEADSETWHTGPEAFHRDRSRWNEIRAQGWEVLVYTYRHYTDDHAHISRTLSAALHHRRPPAAQTAQIA